MAIRDDILYGKSRLVIPTVVIAELFRKLVQRGNANLIPKLMAHVESSTKIQLIDLTPEIASLSAKFGVSLGMLAEQKPSRKPARKIQFSAPFHKSL